MLKKHIEAKTTDINLSELVSRVVLNYKGTNDPTLDDVAATIKQIKFQKQI
jgi:hypothetical protein